MGILCLLFSQSLIAQFYLDGELGTNVGMRIITYSSPPSLNLGKATPNVGAASKVSVGYKLSEKTALATGFSFDQFGYTQRSLRTNQLHWFYYNTVGIPLDFNYQFSPRFRWALGANLNYLIVPSGANYFNRFGAYAQTGFDFLMGNFAIKLSYKHFLNPAWELDVESTVSETVKVTNRFHAISLSLAYRFWESQKSD